MSGSLGAAATGQFRHHQRVAEDGDQRSGVAVQQPGLQGPREEQHPRLVQFVQVQQTRKKEEKF